jgi:hypothetical protein
VFETVRVTATTLPAFTSEPVPGSELTPTVQAGWAAAALAAGSGVDDRLTPLKAMVETSAVAPASTVSDRHLTAGVVVRLPVPLTMSAPCSFSPGIRCHCRALDNDNLTSLQTDLTLRTVVQATAKASRV